MTLASAGHRGVGRAGSTGVFWRNVFLDTSINKIPNNWKLFSALSKMCWNIPLSQPNFAHDKRKGSAKSDWRIDMASITMGKSQSRHHNHISQSMWETMGNLISQINPYKPPILGVCTTYLHWHLGIHEAWAAHFRLDFFSPRNVTQLCGQLPSGNWFIDIIIEPLVALS